MKKSRGIACAFSCFALISVFFSLAASARAAEAEPPGDDGRGAGVKNIRVVVPYLGTLTDVYKKEERGIDLKDSSLMKGLYVQWVRPDVYQWNVFVYQSSDINFSTIWGGHFIFDYYFDAAAGHRNVIGAGLDIISIDMDAGSSIVPLSDFTLLNTIYAPYLRVGRYFLFGSGGGGKGGLGLSVLPWLGVEFDIVSGKLSFIPPGPPVPVKEDIDDRFVFSLIGLNVKAALFHFIEGEVKYTARFDADDYFSDVSALANVFFTRHWGVSYRFRYMENVSGSITYHILGVAAVF